MASEHSESWLPELMIPRPSRVVPSLVSDVDCVDWVRAHARGLGCSLLERPWPTLVNMVAAGSTQRIEEAVSNAGK